MEVNPIERQQSMATPRATRLFRIVGVSCAMALMAMASAFATADAANAIQQGITDGVMQLYNIMLAVVLPVAVLCLAWNMFKVFVGGERGMEQAKKNMVVTIAIIAVVYLAPAIITQVGKWFNGQTDSGWSEMLNEAETTLITTPAP